MISADQITNENFKEYFHDVRMRQMQPGQIMACYSAMADLVNGPEKRQLIELLQVPDKIIPATQVMRRLFHACELDAVRIPMQIIRDRLDGKSIDKVSKKKYRYQIELFFYTWKECVPLDDPHWKIISMSTIDLRKIENENEVAAAQIGQNVED